MKLPVIVHRYREKNVLIKSTGSSLKVSRLKKEKKKISLNGFEYHRT